MSLPAVPEELVPEQQKPKDKITCCNNGNIESFLAKYDKIQIVPVISKSESLISRKDYSSY